MHRIGISLITGGVSRKLFLHLQVPHYWRIARLSGARSLGDPLQPMVISASVCSTLGLA